MLTQTRDLLACCMPAVGLLLHAHLLRSQSLPNVQERCLQAGKLSAPDKAP